MKLLLGAACAASMFASVAAYAAPFDSAYGNTVTQTLSNGMKIVIYVNADGTWQSMVNGATSTGTFTWKDATTACFTQTNPAPTPEVQARMGDGCQKFNESHGVGETWTEKTPDGQSMTVSITAGR
jgi:hypothetical protein